ncbi:ImmA/IrrE family metallo-endopeptidase [Amycolatopsis sp. CA-128772]|uniref:ImmA/IrrE family metallo-endopeptidase n=1 Tax=Amycolatopsis sp. CA-128772 TaxID=2073159 RepID=UPI0018EBECD9|nr:XRE family transcriptional regulator [Amycolatopsis sp. CA-128772]
MESVDTDAAQPRMLVIARESRGMTQGRLAEVMQELDGPGSKISQGYVSRAEAGRLAVTGDRLALYAQALGYPVPLLCVGTQEVGAGVGLVHHRKKQAASAGDLKRIHALLNLTRIQLRALLAGAPKREATGIPQVAVDELTTAADAAKQVRAKWDAAGGPLESVVTMAEDLGAWVACRRLVAPAPLDSGAESVPVDAVSCAPAGEDPLVLLNSGTPAERQRFTLAHELGHMVMHQVPHPEQEKQANAFAAELLMPRRQIRAELSSGALSVPRLLDLKARWKVSMWALLRRAHTLGIISDWQYRTLAVEMSSLGYRTSEPGTFDAETPTAVTSMISQQLEQGHEIPELASAAYLSQNEFVDLYLSCPVPPAAGAAHRPISSTVGEAAR